MLQESTNLEVPDVQSTRQTALTRALNPMNKLAGRVSSKLEEGDYRGAVRLVCSEDVIAEHSSHIPYMPLYRLKHPPPHPDSSVVVLDCDTCLPFHVNPETIMKAITSFPCDSGGGMDSLLPQHL